MTPSRIEQAARNNAIWCDTVCRAHGAPGEFYDALWINQHPVPRFYPNAVTLTDRRDADTQHAHNLAFIAAYSRKENRMAQTLVTSQDRRLQKLIGLAVNAVNSPNSRVAYEKALTDFVAWHTAQGRPGLTKATVQEYKTVLQGQGFSPSTINQRLSAIRKLAKEAADNGLIDQVIANGIENVKGVESSGVRTGNWLTLRQARDLIEAPDLETLKGKRDRAILAVMIGAGLRRSEVAALTFAHLQQREGRWVIVDLIGKRNHVRSVPMPSWTKAAIDAWAKAAAINTVMCFVPSTKVDTSQAMT